MQNTHLKPPIVYHFYADDTVIYTTAATPVQALTQLQLAFNTFQQMFMI